MAKLSIQQLADFARKHSRFYAELYAQVPAQIADVAQLPIPVQEHFWEANTIDDNRLLTGPLLDGIVFKSGGTTGKPKFSVFSKEEWRVFVQAFGQGMAAGGLRPGERVGNLFYSGELYGSFIFITRSMDESPQGVLQFPIAGATPIPDMLKLIEAYQIDVLAGVPTTILALADYLHQHGGQERLKVRKILFGGESMYPEQRKHLDAVFPGVRVLSVGYASTDAGILGYADPSCGPDEHRSFSSQTILEIVDEDTGAPILEKDVPGRVVITNLTRTLMPVIRYPVGDRAMWTEDLGHGPTNAAGFLARGDRKFTLLGRSEEGARIGPVTLLVEDVRALLDPFKSTLGISNFQLVIRHHTQRDQLVIRVAANADAATLAAATSKLAAELGRQKPLFDQAVQSRKIHPLEVEWLGADQLAVNPRTGKLRRVIDQRLANA